MADIKTPEDKDALARVIVLIYGMLEGDRPFWVYAAVKPSQYDAFTEHQNDNKLDLHNFSSYGELIIAGEGQTPPVEVTLKVADVYQTDPNQFFTNKDPKEALEEL